MAFFCFNINALQSQTSDFRRGNFAPSSNGEKTVLQLHNQEILPSLRSGRMRELSSEQGKCAPRGENQEFESDGPPAHCSTRALDARFFPYIVIRYPLPSEKIEAVRVILLFVCDAFTVQLLPVPQFGVRD